MQRPVEVVRKTEDALRAGVVALLFAAGLAVAQSTETIFSPDLAGCKRGSPTTMGALEVCAGTAPGVPSLTVSKR